MTVHGVDISYWQLVTNGSIDFDKMKSLAKFVFIRALYGTYEDSQFDKNWLGAKQAGLLRGAYMFLKWDSSPRAQVDTLMSILGDDVGELPPVIDFEATPKISTPSDALKILYECATYLKEKCGRTPIIYTSNGFFKSAYPKYSSSTWADSFANYPLWIAHYEVSTPVVPAPWKEWKFWQKTSHGDGTLYGVGSLNIDLDEFNGTEEELYNFIGQDVPIPDPEPIPQGENMWEDNALVVAFDTAGKIPVASVDFVTLKNSGVHAVILQCGKADNKLNPDEPSAAFRDSATYAKWFKAATDAGLRVIIDYPFTAMLDSINNQDGTVTMRYLNYLLSGGLQPAAGGGLLLTLESNTWLEGGDNHIVTCTSTNYGKDLANVFGQIWTKFKLVPGIRTGKWFLDKTDSSGRTISSVMAWADKGQDNVPFFFARWRLSGIMTSGDLHSALKDIPDPSTTMVTVGGTQVREQAHYLYFGNYTKWMGYEVGTILNDAVRDSSGNPALFRLVIWNGDAKSFDTYFNFPETNPVPDPDPDPDPTNPTVKDNVIKIIGLLQEIKDLL